MNRKRRQQINKLAYLVREACEIESPVDVDQAVKRLGGYLDHVQTNDFEARIEKVGESFKITLCKDAYEERRRFSVAHEIGHLFLHMGYLTDPEKWRSVGTYTDSVYYRYGHNLEEYEAHEFAAALLMPRAEFIKIAQEHYQNGVFDVTPIAGYFNVSEKAAANRGRWLGLFSWE